MRCTRLVVFDVQPLSFPPSFLPFVHRPARLWYWRSSIAHSHILTRYFGEEPEECEEFTQ